MQNRTYEDVLQRFNQAKKRKMEKAAEMTAYLQQEYEKLTGVKNIQTCIW